MLYHVQKREERRTKFLALTRHPYFGFIVLGLMLLVFQMLYFADIIGISTMRALGTTMIYIIVGLGFSILLGYAGLASLGTAGFVGLGTYLMGYFSGRMGLPFILTLIISLIFGLIVGGIVGFISLRIEGLYLGIITLGLSEILNEVFKNAVKITGGTNGLYFARMELFSIRLSREAVFIFVIFMLVLMMVITWNIINSPTGRAMSAMKNSDSAAQAMGVSLLKYRLMAFIISTIYAVFAGMLYISYFKFTIPSVWTLGFSLSILAAVIVGGSRSILGIILGTFLIFGFDLAILQKIQFFVDNPAITTIFNGLIIVIVVVFYPGGLTRLISNLRIKFKNLYRKYHTRWKEYRYGKDNE